MLSYELDGTNQQVFIPMSSFGSGGIPVSCTEAPDGRILVPEWYYGGTYSNRLEIFNADGSDSSTFVEDFGYGGSAVYRGADILVSSFYGKIERYSNSGQHLGVFASANLSGCGPIVQDFAGNIYRATNAHGVDKYDSAGNFLSYIYAHSFADDLEFFGGNLYVASGSSAVKLSTSGAVVQTFSVGTGRIDQLAVDNQGFLYAATNSKQLFKFAPDGTNLGVLATLPARCSSLIIQHSAVPEPASILALGGLALVAIRKRRR